MLRSHHFLGLPSITKGSEIILWKRKPFFLVEKVVGTWISDFESQSESRRFPNQAVPCSVKKTPPTKKVPFGVFIFLPAAVTALPAIEIYLTRLKNALSTFVSLFRSVSSSSELCVIASVPPIWTSYVKVKYFLIDLLKFTVDVVIYAPSLEQMKNQLNINQWLNYNNGHVES